MLIATTDGVMYLAAAGLLYALWRLWDERAPLIGGSPPLSLEAPGPPRPTEREALQRRPSSRPRRSTVQHSLPTVPPSTTRDSSLASRTGSSVQTVTDRSSPPAPDDFTAETESPFTIERPDGTNAKAVLHTVDAPAEWREGTGCTNLYFDVPARLELSEGVYRITHPRLPAFRARIEPVEAGGRRPDQSGYRAVVVEQDTRRGR